MTDNRIAPTVLGVAWDGTGYGLDGTIWGGEFLLVTERAWERVAHFRPFPLPGGDRAIKEPRRAAVGLLWEIFGDSLAERLLVLSGVEVSQRLREMPQLKPLQAFSPQEFQAIAVMLSRQINTPLTSSVGRLFDAIASLLDLRHQASFEGQAAMELEFLLDRSALAEYYQFDARSTVIDWSPTIGAILQDLDRQLPLNWISTKFHNTLVEIIVAVAKQVGTSQIALTGGCFQNKYLTERAVHRLSAEGFDPYWHHHIPPNDGGLAVGQTIAALRYLRSS
jgi:hydrogenase maturation protein HypF